MVEDVSEPQEEVLQTLSRINRHAVGSAYTYWHSTRSISSNAVVYVHDETLEFRSKQFSSFVILQLCLAETEVDWLAGKTGGTVVIRDHPTSGRRSTGIDCPASAMNVGMGWSVRKGYIRSYLERTLCL